MLIELNVTEILQSQQRKLAKTQVKRTSFDDILNCDDVSLK